LGSGSFATERGEWFRLISAGFNARLDFGELALRGPGGRRPLASGCLSLTLLVLGVLADDTNYAAAVNYLALVADLFH